MSLKRLFGLLAVASIVVLLAALPTAALPTQYSIDITPRPIGDATWSINNSGDVVGSYYSYLFGAQAILWHGNSVSILPNPQNTQASAAVINSSDQVAGYVRSNGDQMSLVEWQGGSLSYLGIQGGLETSVRGINDANHLVGTMSDGKGGEEAFLWENGSTQTLPFGLGLQSTAAAINNKDQIVGEVSNPKTGFADSFLYDSRTGAMKGLGYLPGSSESWATSVNDLGQVMGNSEWPESPTYATFRGFLWQGGTMTALTAGGPGNGDMPLAINNLSQVVGFGLFSSIEDQRAVIWKDGQRIDLNTLIPAGTPLELRSATSINDEGQITGWGAYAGERYAFRLTPVPEVSGLLVLLSGLVCFACYVRLNSVREMVTD